VSVSPKSIVEVAIHWKMIWQHGAIITRFSNGSAVEIPYRVAAGVTFDQENRDLH